MYISIVWWLFVDIIYLARFLWNNSKHFLARQHLRVTIMWIKTEILHIRKKLFEFCRFLRWIFFLIMCNTNALDQIIFLSILAHFVCTFRIKAIFIENILESYIIHLWAATIPRARDCLCVKLICQANKFWLLLFMCFSLKREDENKRRIFFLLNFTTKKKFGAHYALGSVTWKRNTVRNNADHGIMNNRKSPTSKTCPKQLFVNYTL